MAQQNNDAPLNFNPFTNTLQGFIVAMVKKYIHELQTCIPAIVSKVVDRSTVIVTPAVQRLNAEWQAVEWADIKLPVHTPCGAGILLSCPLAVGDTGWIVAGDLNPSLFFQNLQPAVQKTLQRHEYQFGFFMPDKINNYNISSDDEGALVITDTNGGTKISLKTGSITINSSDALNITAENVTITGDTNVSISTGSGGSVTIDGTDWKTHNHTVPSEIPVLVGGNTGATTATATTGGVN